MTTSVKAMRDLTPDEAAREGAVDHARQMAFREALDAAREAVGPRDLPQDHAVDEAVSPSDDGGVHVEVSVTLPD